jgi:hypothetical protein
MQRAMLHQWPRFVVHQVASMAVVIVPVILIHIPSAPDAPDPMTHAWSNVLTKPRLAIPNALRLPLSATTAVSNWSPPIAPATARQRPTIAEWVATRPRGIAPANAILLFPRRHHLRLVRPRPQVLPPARQRAAECPGTCFGIPLGWRSLWSRQFTDKAL